MSWRKLVSKDPQARRAQAETVRSALAPVRRKGDAKAKAVETPKYNGKHRSGS